MKCIVAIANRHVIVNRRDMVSAFRLSALLTLFDLLFRCFGIGSPAGIGAEWCGGGDALRLRLLCGLRLRVAAVVVIVSVFGRLVFRSFRFAVRLKARNQNSFPNRSSS